MFEREGLYIIKGAFKRNDAGQIVSFILTGYTDAGPHGSDIVCMDISTLVVNTVSEITSLADLEPIVKMNEGEGGYLYTEVTSGMAQEQSSVAKVPLENLLLGP